MRRILSWLRWIVSSRKASIVTLRYPDRELLVGGEKVQGGEIAATLLKGVANKENFITLPSTRDACGNYEWGIEVVDAYYP